MKLEGAEVDCHLAAWLIDYLANRPQYVRLPGCESDVVVCSTGAPQGTVLSPFLFTLYTSDTFRTVVISRSSLMTQPLLAVLQRGMSWSTGGSSPALLNGVEKKHQ